MTELCKNCVYGKPKILALESTTFTIPKGQIHTGKNQELNIQPAKLRGVRKQITHTILSITRECPGLPFWGKKKVEPEAVCVNQKAFIKKDKKKLV